MDSISHKAAPPYLNHYILPQATFNTYKYGFYPRTIRDWRLIYMIESTKLNDFT